MSTTCERCTDLAPGRQRRMPLAGRTYTDPWQHGALVVFLADDMTGDDEPVLSSLAS